MIDLTISIPTYNRPQFLRIVLSSIFEQKLVGFNKIVVRIFDNSDNTNIEHLVAEFKRHSTAAREIIYKKNHTNIGLIANVMQCFCNFNSDYIWVIGDDDPLQSEYALKTLYDMIIAHPSPYYFTNCYNLQNDFSRRATSVNPEGEEIVSKSDFIRQYLVECGWVGANVFSRDSIFTLTAKQSASAFPHLFYVLADLERIDTIPVIREPIIGNRYENLDSTTWKKNSLEFIFSFVWTCELFRRKFLAYAAEMKHAELLFLNRINFGNSKTLWRLRKTTRLSWKGLLSAKWCMGNVRFFKFIVIKLLTDSVGRVI